MVHLITQWPGQAAEEVERLTTLPLELAMNGSPRLKVIRSISLYGLSDVRLTFDEGVDPYFARQVVFQRISDAMLPQGVTASMSPGEVRSEEHTSELQSHLNLVCRLLLEKKKK